MTRAFRLLATSFALLGVVAACSSGASSPGSSSATVAGTNWTIDLGALPAAVPGSSTVTVPGTIPSSVTVTLSFSADTATGFSGCNTFTGPYTTVSHTGLQIGPLVATQKACAAQLMVVEKAYLGQLAKVRLFQISGSTLLLTDTNGNVLLRYTKV
jgi:heat shock protein HslJ